MWNTIIAAVKVRAMQPSTWAGLIFIGASLSGFVVDDATVQLWAHALVGIAGAVFVTHNG